VKEARKAVIEEVMKIKMREESMTNKAEVIKI
jgi:hypothetical protein